MNFHDLVEEILAVTKPSESADAYNVSSPGSSKPPNEGILTPLQEMRKLEASRKCKKCHQNDACVVFIPCGHLACCVSCSDAMERCVVCREFITQKLKSFLS